MFEGQAGLGIPQGLARFCSGPVWAEVALLTTLYQAACSRYQQCTSLAAGYDCPWSVNHAAHARRKPIHS